MSFFLTLLSQNAKMINKSYLTIYLFFLISGLVYGQDFHYATYSVDDGLGSRIVNDITIDDNGYTWICSQSNVNFSNGSEFSPLSDVVGNQVTNQDCQRILHKNNKLLIQSFDSDNIFLSVNLHTKGVSKWDIDSIVGKGDISFFNKSDDIYITVTKADSILIYSFDFDVNRFVKIASYYSKTHKPQNHQFAIGPDLSMYLLFDDLTLIVFDADGIMSRKSKVKLPDNTIGKPKYLYTDQTGRIWLYLSDQTEIFLIQNNGLAIKLDGITVDPGDIKITEDLHKNIVLTNNVESYTKHIFFVDSLTNIINRNDLIKINRYINDFYATDIYSQFWVSTFEGAYRFDKKQNIIQSISTKDSPSSPLQGNIIRNISKDNTNTIYFTSESLSNPYYFNIDTIPYKIFQLKNDKLESNFACNFDMHIDTDQKIWRVGCDEEKVSRIEFYNLSNKQYYSSSYDYDFFSFCDAGDQIYIANYTEDPVTKILQFDKNDLSIKPLQIKGKNHLSSADVKVNYIKNDDQLLWVCTNSGLFRYHKSNHTLDILEDHPFLRNINILYFDQIGDIFYIGTRNNGLLVYDYKNKISEKYDTENWLSGQTVASTYVDYNDNIWVATFTGLSLINRKSGFIGQFKEKDGLSDDEFNRYAIESIDSAHLFLGTLNGLTAINIDEYYKKAGPKAWIEHIDIQHSRDKVEMIDLRWGAQEEILIKKENTNLEFIFQNSEHNRAVQYQARIIGQQDKWRSLGTSHTFNVDKLDNGVYTLEVKCANEYGQSSEDILRQTIKVQSSLIDRLWFRSMLLFLTVGIIGGLFLRYRILNERRLSANRSKVNVKFAELELEALRSQMNPHFIFNALGSIQYFIQTADIKSADNYLTKFAMLMRKYLDASKSKFITLDDEFKLLKLYIELEQLRNDYNFDYSIEVDDEIFIADVKIPSMLLQPYVENAIIHGISGLKGRKGLIKIHALYIEGGILQLIIDDNGLGRIQAKKNKMAMGKQHNSRGIGIIDERISALNRIMNTQIGIKTIDKVNELGAPIGTSIIIEIK